MIRKINFSFIFNIIAITILSGAFFIYVMFQETKEHIVKINHNGQIEYVNNITKNIEELIKRKINNNIYETLKNNNKLQKSIETDLQLFITPRYRYIYVVDKKQIDSDEFRFLLDGAKDIKDKSEFGETYIPFNIAKFNEAYKTKKELYFQNKEAKGVWVTYLRPIIINNKSEALIVIDFSMKEANIVASSLDEFTEIFKTKFMFTFFIFIFILIFSYFDKKREKTKELLYKKLKSESKKVKSFNEKLKIEIKNAVNENIKKEKMLQQQSRLAQMGEMISMIAHQWRQPLSAINSSIIAIQSKLAIGKFNLEVAQDRERFLKFLEKKHNNITEYVKGLSETIDDFRNFFKPDKEKEIISIIEPINRALKIVEASMSAKGIKIVTNFNCKDEISMYQNELMQVVLNILKNSEDNFKEKNIQNGYIEIVTSKKDNNYIIEIYDNGGGIPEDIMPNIFDPYFSTKDEKNGTGLGLYMSKIIIEEHHNGNLSATNTYKGVCFKIELEG